MSLWVPLPRRSLDMHWASLLQKLFALLEPAVPRDLRGVLERMRVSPESIDELIQRSNGKTRPDGVSAADAQFISAYTSEEPAIYNVVSRIFNDVNTRLISNTTVDDLSTENMSQTFSADLLACAGFYIRLQQALHGLPERFWVRGTFHRGVEHKYGGSLDQFGGRLVSMFTPKSTSKNKDVALEFAQRTNGTLFTFENAQGWDISEFSLFQREEEVVIGMFNDFTGKVHPGIVDEIVLQGRDPLTLVALGVTSHGKSESLNTLTSGQPRKSSLFNTKRMDLGSCTQKLHVEDMPWLGSGAKVRFVDTPGLADTQGKDRENLGRIQQDISQKIRHVDAFAVMIKYSPTLDNHVKCMLKVYQEHFGEDFVSHLVIVVTHWDYDEDCAERSRDEQHLGVEGPEKYECRMNAILQDVLQVCKPFDFVYLDNKCKPQKNEQDQVELHKQLAKLWKFMNDKGERFDGHKQDSVYYKVVDDQCSLECHFPGCRSPHAEQSLWKVCTGRSCTYFGQAMHYDCWNCFHQGSTCTGTVLCKRTFAERYAEHLPLLLGVSGASACLGCQALGSAFEVQAAGQAVLAAGGELASHLVPDAAGNLGVIGDALGRTFQGATEAMVEMFHGSDMLTHMTQHGWVHALDAPTSNLVGGMGGLVGEMGGPVLGGVLGAAMAWYMYKSKRQEAYDQLVTHYNDPQSKDALSPEKFAEQTVGAYRELQAMLAVTGVGVVVGCAGIGVACAVAPILGCIIGLLGLLGTVALKKIYGKRARDQGTREVREAIAKPHWQIVAQSLRGLDLMPNRIGRSWLKVYVALVNKELKGNVTRLEWERVKSQYRFLALKCHPDKVIRMADDVDGMHAQRMSEATEKFVQIQASFEMLGAYHDQLPKDKWEEMLRGAFQVSGEECSDERCLRTSLAEMEDEVLSQLPAGVSEDVRSLRASRCIKDKDKHATLLWR